MEFLGHLLGNYINNRARTLWLVGICLALAFPSMGQTDLPPFIYTFDVTASKITLAPAPRWGLFRESDDITISTTNDTPIRVLARDGSLVYQGAPLTRRYNRGHYFVETPGDRTQFAVLPDSYTTNSLVGSHSTGNWSVGDSMKAALGPTWERSGHGIWHTVQPLSNVWDWTAMDNTIAALAGTNRKIIYLGAGGLPGFPAWVSTGSTFATLTNNVVRSYTNFVAKALQRYGSQIYAWEIWNEPMLETLGITNWAEIEPFYLTLAKATKIIRDQVAPSVKLIGPSWHAANFGNTPWLRSQGLDEVCDVWTWHDYSGGAYAPDQNFPQMPALPRRLQRYGAGGISVSKPSVVGEIGLFGLSALGCPPPTDTASIHISGISWRRGFNRAAKLVVLHRAANVTALIPHVGGAFAQHPNSNWEILGFDYAPSDRLVPRGPHPKTASFLMACHWLANATLVDYRILSDRIFLYTWQRPGGESLVTAWTAEDQPVAINTSLIPNAHDIFRQPITPAQLSEEPVLFFSSSVTPATLLASVMAALPALNTPPVWQPVDNQSATHNQPILFTVNATDPDNDPLTYSVAPLPAGATLNAVTGVFSWTPSAAQVGSYTLTFTTTDSRGLTATTSTLINVLNGPLDKLVHHWKFDETSGTTATDSAGTRHGTLIDFSGPAIWVPGRVQNALDFNGINSYISLNGASFNLTNNFSFCGWVQPRDATTRATIITINTTYGSTGLRLWMNNANLNAEVGTTAGWKALSLATNVFTSNTWHHLAIVCDKGTLKAYINGQLVGEGVLGGDVIMNPSGQNKIGYEYGDDFRGKMDELMIFQRTLTPQEILAMATGAPTNRAPTITSPGNKSVNENQLLSFLIAGTDPDGDALIYSATGLPSGATFNLSTRTFTWTPSYTQAGSYNVTFSVSDGSLSASAPITITVANVNRAPTLTSPGNKAVSENTALSFTVTGSDPDGDTLTYSASGLPSGATFNPSTRTFAWTPSFSQAGNYNVTFTASDSLLSASQTITISVGAVNRPPVLAAISAKTANENQALSFTISGSDPDGDTLTYSATGLPSGASFNASTRTFAWTPTYSQAGSYTVTFSVSDGSLSGSASVAITVNNVNRPPVLTAIGSQAAVANTSLAFIISGSDPDGESLTYAATGLPAGATFTASTRRFAWTPTPGQVGAHTVTFTVTDGQASASETVSIAVAAMDAPSAPPELSLPAALSAAATTELTARFTATSAAGTALTFSATGLPAGATLSSTGYFNWTPTLSQLGVFRPTISVSDGQETTSATLSLLVVHPDFDWLAGAKLFAYRIINDKIFVYAYKRTDLTSIVFAWTATGFSYPLTTATGLQQVNMAGGNTSFTTLGTTPILFLSDKRVSPKLALDRVVEAIQY